MNEVLKYVNEYENSNFIMIFNSCRERDARSRELIELIRSQDIEYRFDKCSNNIIFRNNSSIAFIALANKDSLRGRTALYVFLSYGLEEDVYQLAHHTARQRIFKNGEMLENKVIYI